MQAELDKVQAAFMTELREVNDKLKTSENAVAELRQMRCNCIFLIFLSIFQHLSALPVVRLCSVLGLFTENVVHL